MTNLLDEPISTVGSVSAKTKFPSNLSWDEFLALPQETRNAALIDGEVIVNPPSRPHERVVGNLWLVFTRWIELGDHRGEVCTQQPVRVDVDRGYQPDFAWYAEGTSDPRGEPATLHGIPGVVVEVFSPSTRRFDVAHKRGDYERVGVGELWFVDPGPHEVLVCRRDGDGAPFVSHELREDDVLTSRLLDGFSVKVSELFQGIRCF